MAEYVFSDIGTDQGGNSFFACLGALASRHDASDFSGSALQFVPVSSVF